MTSEELQQAIEANTRAIGDVNQSINFLVSNFIRPNAQQHLQSLELIDRLEEILERHNQAIVQIDERLDRVVTLVESNAETIARLDEKLEETRHIVAENSSQIAQMGTHHNQMFARLDERLERIDQQQDRSGQQIEAIAELTRSQLAGIIGNGRRIDRLEQQAS